METWIESLLRQHGGNHVKAAQKIWQQLQIPKKADPSYLRAGESVTEEEVESAISKTLVELQKQHDYLKTFILKIRKTEGFPPKSKLRYRISQGRGELGRAIKTLKG